LIKCLNLGCGQRFHPDWVNLDLHPANKSVQLWDLQNDLPFPDGSFDVVYHSHVLEHFSKSDGLRLLERCCRVLRPKGVIRIAVPDLEAIARLYLEALGKSLDGDTIWKQRYEWILLEMYDQAAREAPGGEMLVYLRRDPIPEREFVASRLGSEFRRRNEESAPSSTELPKGKIGSFLYRALARLALGKKGIRAHDAGIFRQSGEVHRWMYDRYSLARLLESAGFYDAQAVGPAESRIPNWNGFHLDTEPDGSVYKPDSLYVEASRR
jgi:predicted SAM-dependent methyltransferase